MRYRQFLIVQGDLFGNPSFLKMNHAVKDSLRILHLFYRECTELYIHGIIREVRYELVVGTAALFCGLGGWIGEGAAEDAGADEGEGDAVEAVVFEDAQGIVVAIEQLLEGCGGPAKVGADCMDDVPGVGQVKGRGDDCGAVLQRSLMLGTGGGQNSHTGLLEDHTADTTASPKTAVCGVDDRIDSLIGAGCINQYDFAHIFIVLPFLPELPIHNCRQCLLQCSILLRIAE